MSSFTMSNFDAKLAELKTALHDGYNGPMAELFNELMAVGADWADDALMEVLQGAHGPDLQRQGAQTLVEGFEYAAGCATSFVEKCLNHDRGSLLRRVVEMDLSEPLGEIEYQVRLEEPGDWLNTLSRAALNFTGGESLPAAPDVLGERWRSPAAPVLAELIIRLAPEHERLASLRGHPSEVLLNAARMRVRIEQLQPDGGESAPNPARRSPI